MELAQKARKLGLWGGIIQSKLGMEEEKTTLVCEYGTDIDVKKNVRALFDRYRTMDEQQRAPEVVPFSCGELFFLLAEVPLPDLRKENKLRCQDRSVQHRLPSTSLRPGFSYDMFQLAIWRYRHS